MHWSYVFLALTHRNHVCLLRVLLRKMIMLWWGSTVAGLGLIMAGPTALRRVMYVDHIGDVKLVDCLFVYLYTGWIWWVFLHECSCQSGHLMFFTEPSWERYRCDPSLHIRDPFHLTTFPIAIQIQRKKSICSHSKSNLLVTTIFSTCHHSCAVVACAKYCSDWMDRNGIITKRIFCWIWVMVQKC